MEQDFHPERLKEFLREVCESETALVYIAFLI
jgi:hypothetical protein